MSESTYVALLRGINVGGHSVAMERLRGLFAELGLARVRSYIQTGNVFFDAEAREPGELRVKIERHLAAALGFAVPTCLRTVGQLEELVALDPFRGITPTPDMRLAVNFLAEPAGVPLGLPYRTPDGAYEVIGSTASEAFVVWYLQDGRPGKNWALLERQLGTPSTSRFWHTTAKILAAARAEPREPRRTRAATS